jgi:hypothetical protein
METLISVITSRNEKISFAGRVRTCEEPWREQKSFSFVCRIELHIFHSHWRPHIFFFVQAIKNREREMFYWYSTRFVVFDEREVW